MVTWVTLASCMQKSQFAVLFHEKNDPGAWYHFMNGSWRLQKRGTLDRKGWSTFSAFFKPNWVEWGGVDGSHKTDQNKDKITKLILKSRWFYIEKSRIFCRMLKRLQLRQRRHEGMRHLLRTHFSLMSSTLQCNSTKCTLQYSTLKIALHCTLEMEWTENCVAL